MEFTTEALAHPHQSDLALHELYLEGYQRGNFEAITNYSRQNYPDPRYVVDEDLPASVSCSILMFHGLEDNTLRH